MRTTVPPADLPDAERRLVLEQFNRTAAALPIEDRTAMIDAMVEWMSFPLYYALDGAEPPRRRQPDQPAEIVGDLAGGRSALPHLLECCDPFVGPAHAIIRNWLWFL